MFDALVRTKPALPTVPTIEGIVCVGIQIATSVTWWRAVFGSGQASTSFEMRFPHDGDAVLLLGEDEANTILKTGALPSDPALVEFRGDRSLMEEMLARYCDRENTLAVRTRERARTEKGHEHRSRRDAARRKKR